MRFLTHPVVVCTALDTSSSGGTQPRAMTMSSFTSLSMAPPRPLITSNVATPSRTLDAIRSSGDWGFNVHILTGNHAGAAVAEHFTRGNADGLFESLEGVPCRVHSPEEGGGGGAPVLEGEGVLCVLRCKVAREEGGGGLIKVRDHVILVGEVIEVLPQTGKNARARHGFGLSYTDRGYRGVGSLILRH